MNLVIVESPAKAKTINKFLGSKFKVESSFGHLRDLPKKEMGIDIEHNFEPKYVVSRDKQKQVTILKKAAAKADMVYLASDEDREGEAISWHLLHILGLEKQPQKYKRIAFHEITEHAIKEALANPRFINMDMVDAQQARRVLDRLVGYELSPFLWKKVARGLSAGRVQSVAVRLIVEREREIQAFKSQEYWTIEADFQKQNSEKTTFLAKLNRINGKALDKLAIVGEEKAKEILKDIENTSYKVVKIEKKKLKKNPPIPFTTSSLQQAAINKLGFSAKQTMAIAQMLYEGIDLGADGHIGLITYMRTDSLNLSGKFLEDAKKYLTTNFDKKYYPETSRVFKTKSKNAQEAHEAIRPTEVLRTPESIEQYLDKNQFRLYDMIWRRSLASQMAEAEADATTVDVSNNKNYNFRANGSVINFDGYLKIYHEKITENILPELSEGEIIDLKEVLPKQHFTEPQPRFNEASLVKALEEYGIGRPSTYAPTISTIQERNYVKKNDDKRLQPTEIGMLVNDVLVAHFPQIVDYNFTAKMEDDLDAIARGETKWVPIIKDFYTPFKKNLTQKYEEVDKKELTEEKTDLLCEKCGSPMVIKMGRFGKFYACSKYPECKTTKPMKEKNEKGEEIPEETTDEKCEKCGSPMKIKHGRYGKFLGCSNYPACKNIKPLAKSTGVKCPKCGEGDIVERRSKRGRTFYSCNQYPKCEFALWSKPTGEKCPDCGSLIVYAAKDMVRCSSKECKFTKNAE